MDELPDNRTARLYKRSLKLYPKKYRQEYGDQLLDMLTDILSEETGQSHFWAWARIWRDLPLNIIREYYYALGDVMRTDEDSRFRKISFTSLGGILIPLLVIVLSHIAVQLGYIEERIKTIIELVAIILPLLAAILALSSLQQITRKFLRQLTKEQHWHSRMLVAIITLSIIVITLALYDVFVTT